MAIRNQPYFPLYVQDYLTDEKLNMCSWKTQGIYIKILCVLHKQKEYGCILFKQNDKQNLSSSKNFALILIRNLPCQLDDMIDAINELIDNEVLIIKDDILYQKRMVKDGQISDERSKAAKKGGGNPNLFKQNHKQTVKQNPEYEYEDENKLKERYNSYSGHLKNQSVYERLAMNRGIKPNDITHCINEFLDSCYASIVEKNNKYAVEEYFLNWIKKEGRVIESLNNQIRKNGTSK